MRKRCINHRMIFLGACLAAVAIGAAAESPRPSGKDDRMKMLLQRFPEADTDKDGVLTAEEERAFRSKFEKSRRQTEQRLRLAKRNRPKLTRADVKYGPHERNVFDLWLPEGASPKTPLPVFVYFHGGGFVAGDKNLFDPTGYLKLGYAVVAANYRFVNGKDILTPVPMQDCTRDSVPSLRRERIWNQPQQDRGRGRFGWGGHYDVDCVQGRHGRSSER